MSSSLRFAAVALLVVATACAGFRRGEYWDEQSTDGEPLSPSPISGADDGGDDESGDSGGDESGQADSGGSGDIDTGDPSGPSFATDILPVLIAGCERCHSPDGAAADTEFVMTDDADAAYETATSFVDTAAPTSSRLLTKAAGVAHQGGVVYDDRSAEYDLILAWIEKGARP